MKKKLVSMMAAALACVSAMGFPSLAAPRVINNTVFDSEYYAATYPDVAAVMGTDPTALYTHYANYGKAEGRIPYRTYGQGVPSDISDLLDLESTALAFYTAADNAAGSVTYNKPQRTGKKTAAYAAIANNAINFWKEGMIDPSSALIRNVRIGLYSPILNAGSTVLQTQYDDLVYAQLRLFGEDRFIQCPYCVEFEVNGKNRMGGYAGYHTIAGFTNSDGSVVAFTELKEEPYTIYAVADASLTFGANPVYKIK